MSELLSKLKTKSFIVIIFALLTVTWQFLNYATLKEYVPLDNFTSFEFVIIYSSYIFLFLLFFSILSLVFTVFRISMKYNSELRKIKKKQKLQNSQASKLPKLEK